jgi:hypothetical protein
MPGGQKLRGFAPSQPPVPNFLRGLDQHGPVDQVRELGPARIGPLNEDYGSRLADLCPGAEAIRPIRMGAGREVERTPPCRPARE